MNFILCGNSGNLRVLSGSILTMSIYYNYDKLFSYNFLLAFVIGERGVGKSFGAKKAVLSKFLKTGEQFIYLRRYKTELDTSLHTFWSDLQYAGEFTDHELKVRKSKMLTEFVCDGKICGYAVPLSTANILKSTAFPNVKTIVFDEFLLDTASGCYRYLKNEVSMVMDVIETVGRLRDIQVIFLGNATSQVNPYFAYLGLSLPYNSEFKTFKDGLIVVNYIRNEAYRQAKKASRFGKLIDGTMYGKYAIDNEFLRDTNDFIAKRPEKSTFYGTLIINGTKAGVWLGSDLRMYISNKYDPNSTMTFACDYNDHSEDTIFVSARENMILRYVVKYYKNGWLRFENIVVKNNVIDLLNRCISI